MATADFHPQRSASAEPAEALTLRIRRPFAAPEARSVTARWRALDAARGELGPWHERHDRADGSKAVIWCLDDGTPGLGDHHLEDLVYLTPLAAAWLPLMPLDPLLFLVIAEGEKSADAIAAAGIPAIGTVCGAASTPGPAVVELLSRGSVIAWPDADAVGRAHFNRLGRALEAAGVPAIAVVRPPVGAPGGWDAADTTPERIRELVADAARRWIGPVAA